MSEQSLREMIEAALAKALPADNESLGYEDEFAPWRDIIEGIHGDYASASDVLLIGAMEAARDRSTFDFIEKQGFAGEFALYVLSGHGLLEYGTSPRGGWPAPEIADLWQPLIDKWKAWYRIAWGEEFP